MKSCKVEYVDHMGTDLSVVNAARVSFHKESDWEDDVDKMDRGEDEHGLYFENTLRERDVRLIKFLARNNHWTPFGHTSVSLRIRAPLFVARQLGKHQVGLVWNEVSRRYVSDDPEFFVPDGWRKSASDKKQGSDESNIITEGFFTTGWYKDWDGDPTECPVHRHESNAWETESVSVRYKYHLVDSLHLYKDLLESGVCEEQARMVLPQSMYTEWIWTGSLVAFSRVCSLRLKSDTQKETRDIAKDISGICSELFPVSWEALSAPTPSTEESN